nr:aconitase family protein [Marinicauda algicola]
MEIAGEFREGVAAKDVMLLLCRELGMGNHFKTIEYGGPAVRAMDMEARMVLSNMAAELGGDTGLIEPDETTLSHIRAHGGEVEDEAIARWRSDAGCGYAKVHAVDASALQPQVAAPHSPANSDAISNASGERIDQAYIGACIGAKLTDLQMAARVLEGRKVARGVRLLVAPASAKVTHAAARDGTLATLTEAGAVILPRDAARAPGSAPGCSPRGRCASPRPTAISVAGWATRTQVWLGSPFTVAASAVTGTITDPREFLGERRRAA